MAFDGNDSIVDKKALSSIKIKATVQKHGRYPKVRIVKFKRRKHYMSTQGHRQGFSEIKIESIIKNGTQKSRWQLKKWKRLGV